MKVKDVLKNCATLLDDSELAASVTHGVFTSQQNDVINMLIECLNLTNTRIASEYLFIRDVVKIQVSNEELTFDQISPKNIFDVISVKRDGYPIQFTVRGGKLCTKQSGILEIEFAYLPEVLDIHGEIDYYSGRITERVFAYGIVAEYLAIKGNVDDSAMWEDKFLKSMSRSFVRHKEIVMPRRRWR